MIDDQTFNNLTWQKVDERELDTFIKDATILETEAIDYPITDGLIFYLRTQSGELYALQIAVDLYNPDAEDALEALLAPIPEL